MIVSEGVRRTSSHFVRIAAGKDIFKDPACKVRLTSMSSTVDVDFMGTVPGNTVCWAVEIATGRIVSGKLLPVIAYVKRSDAGAPTVRPVSPTYTQAQFDAAKAASTAEVAALKGRITGIKSKVAALAADVAND